MSGKKRLKCYAMVLHGPVVKKTAVFKVQIQGSEYFLQMVNSAWFDSLLSITDEKSIAVSHFIGVGRKSIYKTGTYSFKQDFFNLQNW